MAMANQFWVQELNTRMYRIPVPLPNRPVDDGAANILFAKGPHVILLVMFSAFLQKIYVLHKDDIIATGEPLLDVGESFDHAHVWSKSMQRLCSDFGHVFACQDIGKNAGGAWRS
jgi:hypothetical protein